MSVTWGSKGSGGSIWWLVIGVITLVIIIKSQSRGGTNVVQ